jgi:hypothetical protein
MDSLTKAALLNAEIHPEERILQKGLSDSNAIVRRGGAKTGAHTEIAELLQQHEAKE